MPRPPLLPNENAWWVGTLALILALAFAPSLRGATVINGDVTPALPWSASTDPWIGVTGTGTLAVDEGSQLNSGIGYVGYYPGSTGSATITGAGSKWTNRYALAVGLSGSGAVRVESGGQVGSDLGYLGYNIGATGTATITGAGSMWTNSFQLYVGDSGSGALRVEAGGQVSTEVCYLGSTAGSMGAATITGAGSTSTNRSGLYVGYSGSGALHVEAGGQVSNAPGYLGYSASSTGTATITGAGSKWTNGTLFVGYSGSGALRTEAGGQVSSASGYLGFGVGSTGTATITGAGSAWTSESSLYVGRSGSGATALTVENGGQVTTASLYASLSDLHGNGTIAATKGAVLDADLQFNATQPAQLVFGFDAGGTLTVTVAGGVLGAGYKGVGSLTIAEGVAVFSSHGYLGYSTGSTGAATITGEGSTWTNDFELMVGRSGSGSLRVEAGGQVSSAGGYVGDNPNSTGAATITGAGSVWTNSSALYVGLSGSGALTITDGGLVSVRGTLRIDHNGGGDSYINLATGGMLALWGNADDSLAQFLGLVSGTDAIRYWSPSLASWTPLTAATLGLDYTLQYQDAGDLTGYTLLTVLAPGPPGDFDFDGRVDGADFLAWQRGSSPMPNSPEDLATWRANVGLGATTPAATAVPEPETFALVALAVAGLVLACRPTR
jgi:T5SS/PEP-CTERM-associated repeat protein